MLEECSDCRKLVANMLVALLGPKPAAASGRDILQIFAGVLGMDADQRRAVRRSSFWVLLDRAGGVGSQECGNGVAVLGGECV